MFVVLESNKLKPLRRDLSMSKDMREWPRAKRLGLQRTCLNTFLTISKPMDRLKLYC